VDGSDCEHDECLNYIAKRLGAFAAIVAYFNAHETMSVGGAAGSAVASSSGRKDSVSSEALLRALESEDAASAECEHEENEDLVGKDIDELVTVSTAEEKVHGWLSVLASNPPGPSFSGRNDSITSQDIVEEMSTEHPSSHEDADSDVSCEELLTPPPSPVDEQQRGPFISAEDLEALIAYLRQGPDADEEASTVVEGIVDPARERYPSFVQIE